MKTQEKSYKREPFRIELIQPDFTDEPVKHLVFHVYPKKMNDCWRWNIQQLKQRPDFFNGKRFVGVVTDDSTWDAEEVVKEFGDYRVDLWYVAPNNPDLREVVTFVPLMSQLPRGVNDVTAYMQAKGVSHHPDEGSIPMGWAKAMYAALLDHWLEVFEAFKTHPIVGSFKKYDDFNISKCDQWHYSGSFCMFRNIEVFRRKGWDDPPRWFLGVEAWPSRIFASHEGYCLVGENPGDLHRYGSWINLHEELEDFGIDIGISPEGMRIEIGGGTKPHGHGYLNCDRVIQADIAVDLELGQLPFDSGSVARVYSSHCLEHIRNVTGVMQEILRVCKIGAIFILKQPHWLQQMAMCFDHKHVISEDQVRLWCQHSELDFPDGNKRFKLIDVRYVAGGDFAELRGMHPTWTAKQVAKYAPGASHECVFVMQCVERRSEILLLEKGIE